METQGQHRDRQRELRALDRIAAALSLPHLREARQAANSFPIVEAEKRKAHDRYIEAIDNRIREAESVLGIPKEPTT